jgi:signal transduction histidine kinase
MRYHALAPLVAALATLFIGTVVALRAGLRQRLHRAFLWMVLSVVAWNLGVFSLYYFVDPARAEFWNRIFRTGICLAPATIFHFAIALSDSRGLLWQGLLAFAYLSGSLLAVANLRGHLVRGLSPHPWGWYVEPTPLYSRLTLLLAVFFVLWIERVLHAYRWPSTPRQRLQAKFWLLGGLVQILFASTNLLALYGWRIYPLGNLGSIFWVGIIAYAIVRHRLMDLDYVVRKLVSASVAAAVILVPGAIGLAVLARNLGARDPLLVAFAGVGLSLVAAFMIPRIQQALETRLQRALHARRYDTHMRLRELARRLVHILDQRALVAAIGEQLTEILELEQCLIFVREDAADFVLAYPEDAGAETIPPVVTRAMGQLSGAILLSELESLDPGAAGVFHDHGWEVGIPLRINDNFVGIVILGQKRIFRIFTRDDLQLLENARLSLRLHRSSAELERARRLSSIGMLAAGLAHEIRNPLVAVKTFLDLLPQRLDDREFLTHFRDLSQSELRRVMNLLTDLLALGKSTTVEYRSVEVVPTLEPVLRLMESTARKRGVTLVVRAGAALPPVWADADRLKQILLNLVLNAIDVSPQGSEVTVAIRPARQGVLIEVSDHGPGIPPDHLENIFNPFFTTKETGTGLGLALVHQMVVEHGGQISVDSTPGRGSIFRVTLPAAPAALERTGT